jgi:hypothetical protein
MTVGRGPQGEDSMAHKYKVGQLVDFMPGRAGIQASARQYKIVRLLPLENGEHQYLIKCTTDTFERVATEAQLSRRA